MEKGICRWCGAEVERGNEEEHFTARNGLKCAACKWNYVKYDDEGNAAGHYCRFAEIAKKKGMRCRCVKGACRARGIEYR